MTKRNLAICVGILTSFLYGSMSVFSRWMNTGFQPMTQVYMRVLGAALLTSLIFYRQINWHNFGKLNGKEWGMLVLMGTGGYGLMVYAITKGALLTTLLNVSVVFSTVPFFVYALSLIFFNKKIIPQVVVLLLLSVWGVSILTSGNLFPELSKFGVGDWWVLLATVMEAIWFLGIKMLSNKLSGKEIGIAAQAIAGITLLLFSFATHESISLSAVLTHPLAIAGLAGGVMVNMITPMTTYFMFKQLEEVFATQLLLFENVFSLLVGWFFYRETRNFVQLIGATFVIMAVYWMNKTEST